MSRLPKYADDFIPTVEKRQSGSALMNVAAGVMLLIVGFVALRFFGVI